MAARANPQAARDCGRFASGYLVQLAEDDQSQVCGPESDFIDLHAWAEAYTPGAGSIGLDPTSGLLAGQGHIPLACTSSPASAAAITGSCEASETRVEFSNVVRRIHESPRVMPYPREQWQRIDALGHAVDAKLNAGDVRLTMGGEPTWSTGRWLLRRGHLFLIPGDSPIGMRLPLDSLTWTPSPPATEQSLFRGSPELDPDARVAVTVAQSPPVTALCVELRDGHVHVFILHRQDSPDSEHGRLGVVELCGFEMPPHPEMALVQALLVRARGALLDGAVFGWAGALGNRVARPLPAALVGGEYPRTLDPRRGWPR